MLNSIIASVIGQTVPPVPQPKSIASITAGLTTMVEELTEFAKEQQAACDFKLDEADRLRKEAAAHEDESYKATKIAEKVAALVS